MKNKFINSLSRRQILAGLGTLSAGLILKKIHWDGHPYEFTIEDDFLRGHHLFKKDLKNTSVVTESCEYLVVGGGVAGSCASFLLKDKDVILCELGNNLGGSAVAGTFNGQKFHQGAHYVREYGLDCHQHVPLLLQEANIVRFNDVRQRWEFNDSNFVVDSKIVDQYNVYWPHCYHDFLKPISNGQLVTLYDQFQKQLHLPTRLTPDHLKYLNTLTFSELLKKSGITLNDTEFVSLSSSFRDDYSGTPSEVSALAGLLYYLSHPICQGETKLFSPPQGNSYFVETFIQASGIQRVYKSNLVYNIQEDGKKFKVLSYDFNKSLIRQISADKIIYAGQKHALKYVFPKDSTIFENHQVAPWVVTNFILNKPLEIIPAKIEDVLESADPYFMGFVSSSMQDPTKNTILTSYYAYTPAHRKDVLASIENPKSLIEQSTHLIKTVLGHDYKKYLEKVIVRIHGHAMPIPVPNYLLNNGNQKRSNKNLVYAGIDNFRLPLLYEAIDSSIEAIETLKEKT